MLLNKWSYNISCFSDGTAIANGSYDVKTLKSNLQLPTPLTGDDKKYYSMEGENNYAVRPIECVNKDELMCYLNKLVRTYRGPGKYCYNIYYIERELIYEDADDKYGSWDEISKKEVYEYCSTIDYDPEEHDEHFDDGSNEECDLCGDDKDECSCDEACVINCDCCDHANEKDNW